MKDRFKKANILIIIIVSLVLLFYIGFYAVRLHSVSEVQKRDYERIASEKYDTVFFSMFPIYNYETEPFAYYRGQQVLRLDYSVPNLKTIQTYLNKIVQSGNGVSCIYLGILPDKLDADGLFSLLAQYPDIPFQIILPYPYIDYWKGLSDSEFSQKLETYRTIADTLLHANNCSVYLFADQWLICNPANYTDTFVTNTDISFTLMMNCDYLHSFMLTSDNIEEHFSSFLQLVTKRRTSNPASYIDFTGKEIVFFGDSIIGEYTDSASIPGVVNGLTGADVYNLGYGGNSAAWQREGITLPGIVDAFIQKNLSLLPKDTQVYRGTEAYLEASHDTVPAYFVINYGLNDYFKGLPISSEDLYDITTYTGALRTAVKALRDNFPSAEIILMTPNYAIYSDKPTPGVGEGAPLTDYVQAVRDIGAEADIIVIDNFADLGINFNNVEQYLPDGVHPNEATRFIIGEHIAHILQK